VAGGLRTARSAAGSFQKVVSVVAPTTIPHYSAFPGIGQAVFRHAVCLAAGTRFLDRWHAQKTETGLIECDVLGYLTCEMHGALLSLNTTTTYDGPRRIIRPNDHFARMPIRFMLGSCGQPAPNNDFSAFA
jgi:hypothetical protein